MTVKRQRESTGHLFDRTGAVRRPSYARLPREVWALVADRSVPPDTTEFPAGDGHAVLVVPAFLCGDLLTRPLRQFLSACGYRAEAWELGVNWGPTEHIANGLRVRLDALHAESNRAVSVVGVSLGGVMARDLAYDRPRAVRHVVTLASPFNLPTASTIEPLFRLCAMLHSRKIEPRRLAQPLPVPSTAIYTRDDGIVAWQSCFCSDSDCFVAEIAGPHMSIGHNPAALRVLATRLAAVPPRE